MEKERTTNKKVIMELVLPFHPQAFQLSHTHVEVELLKEQEEQGCSQGKAGQQLRSPGTGRGSILPSGAQPQLGKQDRLVTTTDPGMSENSGTNMETRELRAGLGAGLRILTPQLERRSVIKR